LVTAVRLTECGKVGVRAIVRAAIHGVDEHLRRQVLLVRRVMKPSSIGVRLAGDVPRRYGCGLSSQPTANNGTRQLSASNEPRW
jgi:hypothetical protein